MGLRTHLRRRWAKAVDIGVYQANRWMGHFDEVLWLIGVGRSGTTWLADLINHDGKYHELFEPHHPTAIEQASFLRFHQYVRPQDDHPQLLKFTKQVFGGGLRHPRIGPWKRRFDYQGLLVKDIFTNLFASWAALRFPHVHVILLLRNPFAVALSRYKTADWGWVTDPMWVLDQPHLRQDFLAPYEDLIRGTCRDDDYIVKQVLLWAMVNYVPLAQFSSQDIYVAFYEEFCVAPVESTRKLYESVSGRVSINLNEENARRASRVATSQSNILKGKSPIHSWKNELSTQQIDAGLAVLHEFGFGDLYDETCMPNRQTLFTSERRAA